jgi:cbb3-type cytochrome oxidase cytochrome c subunit
MALMDKHAILEKNATLLLVCSLLVVTIGGIVEIAPLFYLENTIEKVEACGRTRRSNWRAATSISAKAAMSAIRR